MTMRLLLQTPDCDRTVLLADPSGRIARILVPALGGYLDGAEVRVVSSPEDPPWKGTPPPWVRASWYRAVWLGLPRADRQRLAVVASREATRMQELDPTRCRSVVALVDPHRTAGFLTPIDQWTATGDLLADVSCQSRSSEGAAAVDQVAEEVALVAADAPLPLVRVVAGELGIGPKRAHRMANALQSAWPSFGPSSSAPHWLDVELYGRARSGRTHSPP